MNSNSKKIGIIINQFEKSNISFKGGRKLFTNEWTAENVQPTAPTTQIAEPTHPTKLRFALYVAILTIINILLLGAACSAQTLKFRLQNVLNINTNTITEVYSDFGTDFYRMQDGKKIYVSLSSLQVSGMKQLANSEIIEVIPAMQGSVKMHTMTTIKAQIPAVTATKIAAIPAVKRKAKLVVSHYDDTTPLCDAYLAALRDTNIIVIDTIMIADNTNKADYAALLQEIRETNKAIGYNSKILNKANIGLQTEINGFATLVYNDCHKRPTVFGYLGAYPVYKACLFVKDLSYKLMKLGRNKKLNQLKAAKKELLKRKQGFAKL